EDERLGEADHEERAAEADRQLAEDARARDVRDPRRQLAQEVLLLRSRRRLLEAERDERRRGDDERRSVDERDGTAARGGVDAGAGERRDDPQPLAQRLERAVRIA